LSESVRQETNLILKHSSVYGIATILSRVIGFLMIPVYTAYITPEEYGVMELIHITMSLIETVVALGVTAGLSRLYFDTEDQRERNRVVSSAFFGLGAFLVLLIGGFMTLSGTLATVVLDSIAYKRFFLIAFSSLAINILNNIFITYYRINKRSMTVLLISVGQLTVNLSLNIFFLVVLKMSVWGIFVATFITAVLTFVIFTPVVIRKVGVSVSWAITKELVAFGLPLIPSNIASYIVAASDRYFIKEYVSINDTGLYSLGYKFGTLVNAFVTQPFNQIWGPRRIEMFGKGNYEQIFTRIFTYFALMLIFVGMTISILARDIVHLMADKAYWSAYAIIPLITLAHVIFSFYYHFYVPIFYEKKTKYFAYINVMNAILNLSLNFVLIKPLGVWGAALSTLVCYIFRSGSCFYFANKLHKINVEWRRILTLFGIALAYFMLFGHIEFHSTILSAGLKVVICSTYPVLLYFAGMFSSDEKEQIRDLIKTGWKKITRRESAN